MADRDFQKAWNIAVEIFQVCQRQVMSGIQAYTLFFGLHCRFHEILDSHFRIITKIAGIAFGIKLHPVSSGFLGCGNHGGISIHKDAGSDALTMEFLNDFGQEMSIGDGIPARIGSQCFRRIGHKSDLCRFHVEHQLDKLFGRIALYIEFCSHDFFQVIHILVADVTLVRARMHRNALSSKTLTINGCRHHIGHITATCITQSGDFINIDTQSRFVFHN